MINSVSQLIQLMLKLNTGCGESTHWDLLLIFCLLDNEPLIFLVAV